MNLNAQLLVQQGTIVEVEQDNVADYVVTMDGGAYTIEHIYHQGQFWYALTKNGQKIGPHNNKFAGLLLNLNLQGYKILYKGEPFVMPSVIQKEFAKAMYKYDAP